MQMYSIFEVESIEITGPKELWANEALGEPTFLVRINIKYKGGQSLITLYSDAREALEIKEETPLL